MQYDHFKKAGNLGDVIKHPGLIAATSVICKSGVTFRYADTFAGYAFNPLLSSGQWKQGIGKLLNSSEKIDNPHVAFWRQLWHCSVGLIGSTYPGSSVFVLKACLQRSCRFIARLWDVSPLVITQLMTAYNPSDVSVFPRSATADDFGEPKPAGARGSGVMCPCRCQCVCQGRQTHFSLYEVMAEHLSRRSSNVRARPSDSFLEWKISTWECFSRWNRRTTVWANVCSAANRTPSHRRDKQIG